MCTIRIDKFQALSFMHDLPIKIDERVNLNSASGLQGMDFLEVQHCPRFGHKFDGLRSRPLTRPNIRSEFVAFRPKLVKFGPHSYKNRPKLPNCHKIRRFLAEFGPIFVFFRCRVSTVRAFAPRPRHRVISP